jgi:hypothetical protein
MLDGRKFNITRAATIRRLVEILLQRIKELK